MTTKPISPKPRTVRATLQSAARTAAEDELEEILGMSDTELDQAINAAGGDAKAIRARGASFAKELMDRRTRLAWHAATEGRIDTHRASADAARSKALQGGPIPRVQLLARLETARRDARFATPIAMMFRKKSAEESTDEELRSMLEEIDLLAKTGDKS